MADKLSRTVLYNENLEPPTNTTEVPDTPDGHLSGETLIAQGNGWQWTPEPAEPEAGLQSESVTYAPVEASGGTTYEDMTVTELKDEIRKRNEQGAEITLTGDKEDLIGRLHDHDKAQEG